MFSLGAPLRAPSSGLLSCPYGPHRPLSGWLFLLSITHRWAEAPLPASLRPQNHTKSCEGDSQPAGSGGRAPPCCHLHLGYGPLGAAVSTGHLACRPRPCLLPPASPASLLSPGSHPVNTPLPAPSRAFVVPAPHCFPVVSAHVNSAPPCHSACSSGSLWLHPSSSSPGSPRAGCLSCGPSGRLLFLPRVLRRPPPGPLDGPLGSPPRCSGSPLHPLFLGPFY